MDLTLAYKAFPCAVFPLTAQKPLMPISLRACFNASPHFFRALCAKAFLDRADAALLSFLPLKTAILARLPLAMTLTFFTFFMAFMAFMAAAFMAFMAFMPGLAFIARAMTTDHEMRSANCAVW